MAVRTEKGQNDHDKAIKDIANHSRYTSKIGTVFMNPGNEHNLSVNDQYPDIGVYLSYQKKVAEIGEVETADSVDETEALLQWADYGKLGVPFDLFVPSGSYTETSELVKKYSIKVREIVIYSYEAGRIKLV